MRAFISTFPELGAKETRVLLVGDHQPLPRGEYSLMEFYCDEPGCDCRRVTILVLRQDTGWEKVWATISYGWENVEFYERWGGSHSDAREMQGPILDPLNDQSRYSKILLALFLDVLQSPGYVERLKSHYAMFRADVEKAHSQRIEEERSVKAKRRRKNRDPRRR